MPLYLDSADIEDVRRAIQLGFVAGVTTNPALIAQTGRPGLDVLRDILKITTSPVFYQVTADTIDGRHEQAKQAAALAKDRVIIKIPATIGNISMAAWLADEGVRCAITAVSSPAQAYLAAQARADYAIPYVNRLTRQLGDGIAVLRDCAAIVKGTRTKILAASLKSADEVVAAALNGADDITIPLDLILSIGNHELSEKAIADFEMAMHVPAQ